MSDFLRRNVAGGLRLRAAAAFFLAAVGGAWAEDASPPPSSSSVSYPVVDTGQRKVFDNQNQLLAAPKAGKPFFGQDGHYEGRQPAYRDNGDGTVTDLVTGLMWQKTPDLENQATYPEAVEGAARLRLGGHDDWRLPTIKELYSLIDFNGTIMTRPPVPYLDARYFDFRFGDEEKGDRIIDAQYWTSTASLSPGPRGEALIFGVNFADGRIKAYPRDQGPRGEVAKHFVRYVRGNPAYGKNRLADRQDGTIEDAATGLMWTKADSGKPLNWQEALAWAEGLELAGHTDWRLPNAKELQSLVDYGRAPDAPEPSARGAAIDPVFDVTDEEGWYWTGTTHLDGIPIGMRGVYIAFGRATGFMPGPQGGEKRLLNVHGAGAQRSDPKSGDPQSPQWAQGFGPQGDVIRIFNYARAVRDTGPGGTKATEPDTTPLPKVSPPPGGPGMPPPGGQGFPPPPPHHQHPPHPGRFPPPGM